MSEWCPECGSAVFVTSDEDGTPTYDLIPPGAMLRADSRDKIVALGQRVLDVLHADISEEERLAAWKALLDEQEGM